MTQTIDQRARELLDTAHEHYGLKWDGTSPDGLALDYAFKSALTRIEELEGALGFYASVVRYQGPNQRAMPDDKWTDDDAVYRLDVTRDGGAIARATLTQGIKE